MGAAEGAGLAPTYTDSLSTDRLVGGREEKQRIARRHPVGIVNMEDYWIAAAARDTGAAFLSARVVLDPARQALPRYLLGLGGSRARTALTAVAAPWRIPTLVRLACQLGPAQRVLTSFALSFLDRLHAAEQAVEEWAELSAAGESSGAAARGENGSSGRGRG